MVGEYGDDNESESRTGHCFFKASDELMASYDETPGDLRKARYIVKEQNPSYDGALEYYIPQAFGKIAVSQDNYRRIPNRFGRSLRLSEAYLNLSEAAAMLYKEGNAGALTRSLQALNTLRQYRFAHHTNVNISDPTELVAFVQRERRRELCFEDHRWFDLRRWGLKELKHEWASSETTYQIFTLKGNDPSYTLPFPEEVIKQNPSIEQNTLAPAPRVD